MPNKTMNIIVANSVGIDRDGYHMVHVPSRWSLGVKNFTNCGYYPWELAYTSSLLKRETNHHVKFMDGVLNGWDFETYFTSQLVTIFENRRFLKDMDAEWLMDLIPTSV